LKNRHGVASYFFDVSPPSRVLTMGDSARHLVGRTVPLSLSRRLICDMLHHARQVPSVPVQRRMNLRPAAEARQRCRQRPGWVSLFVRAYGLVAARTPALRRAYLSFPWPRLYEHPENIATVALSRQLGEEEILIFGPLRGPENQGVAELDGRLRHYKTAPLESLHCFRWAWRITKLPTPLRRLAWWIGLDVSGYQRARRFGTFGVSVYSKLGADSLHPLSPLTTVLNYGPIAEDGGVDVRIVYDHRVLDGGAVARALTELEEELNGSVRQELLRLAESQAGGPSSQVA
jgi:hypothetical protein